MKNSKLTFVLWSGGLDSTYMIQKLLDDDKDRRVHSGYVELINNHDKTVAEKRARQAMIPILQKKYGDRFYDCGVIHRAEICLVNCWSPLVQMPIWFNALIGSTPKEANEVCLGYVMNDCAISYLNELKLLFRCFSRHISSSPFPKVTFPLSKECKDDFVYRLDPELKPHVTWCEMPFIKYKPEPKRRKKNTIYERPEVESITPCGRCDACKHSPILRDTSPIECEKFVETYNKSESAEQKTLIATMEKDVQEFQGGQQAFTFYIEEMEKIVHAKTCI